MIAKDRLSLRPTRIRGMVQLRAILDKASVLEAV